MDHVVDARNASCRVISRKVFGRDGVKLDIDFLKEDLFASLSSMKNGKLLGMDCLFVHYRRS